MTRKTQTNYECDSCALDMVHQQEMFPNKSAALCGTKILCTACAEKKNELFIDAWQPYGKDVIEWVNELLNSTFYSAIQDMYKKD